MFISLTIGALLITIAVLATLLSFALHTIRTLTHLHFRELVTTRHQYKSILSEQRAEIRALTQSLANTEGKVYIPPESISIPQENLPQAQPSSFRFKPNPPFVRFKENK